MNPIPFRVIDWNPLGTTESKGQSGTAFSKCLSFDGLRVRIVSYSKGYLADHWCSKGHIVHCLEGEFTSEQADGTSFLLKEGMTYIVSDNVSTHRSTTKEGVKLLIIDGEFLKPDSHE